MAVFSLVEESQATAGRSRKEAFPFMSNAILRQRIDDRMDPGYIYVVQMQGHEVYKIGRSSNVPRRMSEIGVQMPFPYRLVFARKVPYVHYTEADLHRDFSWCRTNGEWFALSAESLQRIDARLLYAQAEWLLHRVIERFKQDDLYPNVLRQYGRVFFNMSKRNGRRLDRTASLDHQYHLESLDADVLSAEMIG